MRIDLGAGLQFIFELFATISEINRIRIDKWKTCLLSYTPLLPRKLLLSLAKSSTYYKAYPQVSILTEGEHAD
jgi:hypothetical protein